MMVQSRTVIDSVNDQKYPWPQHSTSSLTSCASSAAAGSGEEEFWSKILAGEFAVEMTPLPQILHALKTRDRI